MQTQTTIEAEIRARMDEWLEAVRSQDVERIGAFYAEDIRAFDAVERLEFRGREGYTRHWAECLAVCPGPMVFEVDHLEIEAAGDLAVVHALNRCGATGEDGQEKASWMRSTVCFRKIAGRWQIVHEHYSVPFDMKTGAPLFGLTP